MSVGHRAIHANSREDVEKCNQGDIVTAIGLKTTFTGHTLCDVIISSS